MLEQRLLGRRRHAIVDGCPAIAETERGGTVGVVLVLVLSRPILSR